MRNSALAAAPLLLIGFVEACDHPVSPATAPRPTPSSVSASAGHRRPPFPSEARFAALAADFPGFGGYAFDRDGNLTVYLTDLRQTQAVVARLTPRLREYRDFRQRQQRRTTTGPGAGPASLLPPVSPAAHIVVKQGQFGWADLSDWRDELVGHLPIRAGVTFVDLDESVNRIVIGVERERVETFRSVLDAEINALGIPSSAVVIHETGPATPLAGMRRVSRVAIDAVTRAPCSQLNTNSIRDRQRPLVGGLMTCRLSADFTTLYDCTIGFITTQYGDTTKRFVTASHCSEQTGTVDSSAFGQPDFLPSNRIGTEAVDPPFSTYVLNCPSGAQCRNSDALLSAPLIEPANVGEIARTYYWPSPAWYSINTNINTYTHTSYSHLDISRTIVVGDEPAPEAYYQLDYMAASSGWTYGTLTRICVTEYLDNKIFACADVLDALGQGGDSGAPVFDWTSDPNEQSVTLYGILSGKINDAGTCSWSGTCLYFSPTYQIDRDFPGLMNVHP